MLQDFQNITGVGVAGLAVYFMFKLTSNHIRHMTDALNELIKVIQELREFMQNHLKTK